VAGRGVTGDKKLINVCCGEGPNVMCCASATSSIIGTSTTHHVRTFTTKYVDKFLITSAVISDTPAGHIFTEVCPQLQWCLWVFSVFVYLCTRTKSTFYTFLYSGCILLPSYWWHKFIIKILNWFYVFMWWTCTTFYINNFKNISYVLF
jgi:hypothetical protein